MSGAQRRSQPCRFGFHRPGRTAVYNHGRHFTVCAHCGVDLLARRRGWREAPVGLRIIWRKRADADLFAHLKINLDRRRSFPGLRRLLRGMLGRAVR